MWAIAGGFWGSEWVEGARSGQGARDSADPNTTPLRAQRRPFEPLPSPACWGVSSASRRRAELGISILAPTPAGLSPFHRCVLPARPGLLWSPHRQPGTRDPLQPLSLEPRGRTCPCLCQVTRGQPPGRHLFRMPDPSLPPCPPNPRRDTTDGRLRDHPPG